MNRVLSIMWLILVGCLAVLAAQMTGVLKGVPRMEDVPGLLRVETPTRTPVAASPAAVAAPSACTPEAPRFVHGTAELAAALGPRMGQPVECERVVDDAGDTEQQTTTGLAYYRARKNIVVFTDGAEHWALTGNGLVHWTSADLEPPPGSGP